MGGSCHGGGSLGFGGALGGMAISSGAELPRLARTPYYGLFFGLLFVYSVYVVVSYTFRFLISGALP